MGIVGLIKAARAIWVIERSGQFDRAYYRDTYERSDWAVRAPLTHYVLYGAARGHHPSSIFDRELRGSASLPGSGGLQDFLNYLRSGTEFPLAPSPAGVLGLRILRLRRALYHRFRRNECMRLIRESSIFDADYYRRTYEDAPSGDAPALEHYLSVGLLEGRYPNGDFDPIAYRLKYRDAAYSPLPALVHYLVFGRAQGRSAPHGMEGALANYVPDSHHKFQTNFRRKGIRARDRDRIHAVVTRYKGRPGEWIYNISEGESHRVRVRGPSWYVDKIARDEPMTFIKRTHGTRDIMATWFDNRARLSNLPLSAGERAHLASRLSLYRSDSIRREAVKFLYVDNFPQELERDLAYRPADDHYCHAISLTGAQVTPRRPFFSHYSALYLSKLRRLIARSLPPGEYHDAGVWKHAVVSGDIQRLHGVLRQRPVFFVGMKPYAMLGERLGWEDFTHIEIPPAGTMAQRVTVIRRIRDLLQDRFGADLRERKDRPVVFISAGMLAQWLAHRLHLALPGGVYLDVGQMYCPWIVDVHPTVQYWLRFMPEEMLAAIGILDVLGRAPEDVKQRYRKWMKFLR